MVIIGTEPRLLSVSIVNILIPIILGFVYVESLEQHVIVLDYAVGAGHNLIQAGVEHSLGPLVEPVPYGAQHPVAGLVPVVLYLTADGQYVLRLHHDGPYGLEVRAG